MLPLSHICFMGLLILGQPAMAQDTHMGDQHIPYRWEQGTMTLPFRMVNNLILMPVQINGSDTLQFILTTGLENSIICELEKDRVISLKRAGEIKVLGIGPGQKTDAILSKGNHLKVGDLTIPDQDFVILSNNSWQLSRKMGTRIHGLLNMKAFEEYIIAIDYDQRQLILYQPGFFNQHMDLDGYTSFRLDIGGIPCIMATIETLKNGARPVKLMLDTGAGHALTLDTLPEDSIAEGCREGYLGFGINGNIKGKVGRLKGMDIGPYHLQDVPVFYPDPLAVLPGRAGWEPNGSLGAELLRRFNLIIDYPGNKLHMQANTHYEDEFHTY